MSTSTVAARRSPSRPLNWRALLLGAGIVLAIAATVVVLALTSTTTTPSTSPRLVSANSPAAVAAYESDTAHFGNHSTQSVQPSQSSALGWGMGHR